MSTSQYEEVKNALLERKREVLGFLLEEGREDRATYREELVKINEALSRVEDGTYVQPGLNNREEIST